MFNFANNEPRFITVTIVIASHSSACHFNKEKINRAYPCQIKYGGIAAACCPSNYFMFNQKVSLN
jgi:hypothetical protein